MTQTDELIHDLRSALPSIKSALDDGDQAVHRLDSELAALLASLGKTRTLIVGPNKNPTDVQRAMSVLATHQQELERIYASIRNQRQAVRNRRQEAETSFAAWDQKINQLFNTLSAVLKSEREMELGITRHAL
jgi:chromosome segregation ATPase